MANKRKTKRYIKRCEVEFQTDTTSGKGISSDFSLTGLFIRTRHPLEPSTLLRLSIYLPNGSVANMRAIVRRAAKSNLGRVMGAPAKMVKDGMGVELIEKDPAYLHFLSSMLTERSEERQALELEQAKLARRETYDSGHDEEEEEEEQYTQPAPRRTKTPQQARRSPIKNTEQTDREARELAALKKLFMNNVYMQEALINLLVKKGLISKLELLEEIRETKGE